MSGIINVVGENSRMVDLRPNMPYFTARDSSGGQTVAHSTYTHSTAMTVSVDTHNAWSSNTYTIPETGYYHIIGNSELYQSSNNIGGAKMSIEKTGSTLIGRYSWVTYSAGWQYPLVLRHIDVNVNTVEHCVAGTDNLKLYFEHMSGNGSSGSFQKTSFLVYKIGI